MNGQITNILCAEKSQLNPNLLTLLSNQLVFRKKAHLAVLLLASRVAFAVKAQFSD
jgi:hypothetical protein